MAIPDLPTFAELRRRFGGEESTHGEACTVSMSAALQLGDPWSVLTYLRDLDRPVNCLSDLESAVNGLEDEKELAAFWCVEGVALSAASDGRWLLFTQ